MSKRSLLTRNESIRNVYVERERKDLVQEAREAYAPNDTRIAVTRKTSTGYHMIGIGAVAGVNGFDSVKACARTAGFTHVKMGAVKAKV